MLFSAFIVDLGSYLPTEYSILSVCNLTENLEISQKTFDPSQPVFTCSKSTIEIPGQPV